MLLKEISILGRKVKVASRGNLKGLSIGERMSYAFYDGIYQGVPLLFLEPRKDNPTPRECKITSGRIADLFSMPVVFILKSGPTYERQRLMDKGVYFVMSDHYAHLPMLVALEKTTNRKKSTVLTPVAQYLLLYHLQESSLEGLSAKEIAELIPYSYESATLGISCLEDVGLCKKIQADQGRKTLHFELKGEDLWEEAQSHLKSPLGQRVFCDDIRTDVDYPVCGINALAHYTWINPDSERMFMLSSKEYRLLKGDDVFVNPNPYDGDYVMEVWKYPAVGLINEQKQWVDRLSLALTLKTDNDPRIEKEVERMIKETQWKD